MMYEVNKEVQKMEIEESKMEVEEGKADEIM